MLTQYEAFCLFKERNPEIKIGFSKFAEARPKNVVLPGSSGTHNVIEGLHSEVLAERFKLAKTIKGTLKFHSYSPIPGCEDSIMVKQYDLSPISKKVFVKTT